MSGLVIEFRERERQRETKTKQNKKSQNNHKTGNRCVCNNSVVSWSSLKTEREREQNKINATPSTKTEKQETGLWICALNNEVVLTSGWSLSEGFTVPRISFATKNVVRLGKPVGQSMDWAVAPACPSRYQLMHKKPTRLVQVCFLAHQHSVGGKGKAPIRFVCFILHSAHNICDARYRNKYKM